jgi:hypothetical protein
MKWKHPECIRSADALWMFPFHSRSFGSGTVLRKLRPL